MLYVRCGSNCAFAADFFCQRNFRPHASAVESGNGAKAALGAFLGGGGRAYAQNGLTPAWKSAEGRRA